MGNETKLLLLMISGSFFFFTIARKGNQFSIPWNKGSGMRGLRKDSNRVSCSRGGLTEGRERQIPFLPYPTRLSPHACYIRALRVHICGHARRFVVIAITPHVLSETKILESNATDNPPFNYFVLNTCVLEQARDDSIASGDHNLDAGVGV